jgi:UDP-N-acetylmuramyl pentapeptide synthase
VVTHIPEDVKEMLISLLSKIRVLLQEFAANYRGFFFIIIVGSNGKTIVKEWLNFFE